VALKYAIQVNGVTMMMKGDVLSGNFESLYRLQPEKIAHFLITSNQNVTPVYKNFKGGKLI
jgi:adenylosuccinate synthase